ncbi:hypothetical protein OJAV_G00091470 [Oryzias javanicus]|uniref:RING-type domain-containing protein n=1 Tax=Oryzias javanicus TaxID=123683 RepID=A0A437D0D6_ORYJA|nr:hypothetical protein OJAV_G00091470 [Oryzias javanicus]
MKCLDGKEPCESASPACHLQPDLCLCLRWPSRISPKRGHWAAAVHESQCSAGSELVFWVSAGGSVYLESNNTRHKLLSGVDLGQPLWAMIDIYGQTRSIFLLGSEMKGGFYRRKSCPVSIPELPISPKDSCNWNANTSTSGQADECISCLDMDMSADETCVVCMWRAVKSALPCGHKCLCSQCTSRVLLQFGTCPLCREDIRMRGSPGNPDTISGKTRE